MIRPYLRVEIPSKIIGGIEFESLTPSAGSNRIKKRTNEDFRET